MSTQPPKSKYLEQAQAKAVELKIDLPTDMSEEEHLDFIRCGNVELYELNREADKIQRERIKIREEQAAKYKAEEDKRAKRDQIARDRANLESEKVRLLAPPPPDEPAEKDPEGFESLHPSVQSLARRIWAFGVGWNETNKIGLVKMFAAMPPAALSAKAAELRDAMACDAYSPQALSPAGLLKGYGGIVTENMRMLAGGDDALKMLGADAEEPVSRKGRKGRRRREESEEAVADGFDSGSPWGD